MANVAQIVAKLVQNRPFLEEMLVKEIINYAYLADMLKPEIENELKKQVNRYAVIMALRRLSDQLKESFVSKTELNFKDLDITITSGIFEITVTKDVKAINNISKLYGMVDFSKGDFLTATQGIYEITILSNTKYRERMQKLFDKDHIIKVIPNLSSLIVRIPVEVSESVGLLYALTKALSWENINIVECVSTLTEEIFIIKESDASMAFDAIRRLIKEH